jgi:hypothetical protein
MRLHPSTQFRRNATKRVPGSGELLTKFEQGEVLQRRIRQPEGNKMKKVRLYISGCIVRLFIVYRSPEGICYGYRYSVRDTRIFACLDEWS